MTANTIRVNSLQHAIISLELECMANSAEGMQQAQTDEVIARAAALRKALEWAARMVDDAEGLAQGMARVTSEHAAFNAAMREADIVSHNALMVDELIDKMMVMVEERRDFVTLTTEESAFMVTLMRTTMVTVAARERGDTPLPAHEKADAERLDIIRQLEPNGNHTH